MHINVIRYWDRFRSSFWFLPALMAGGAAGLAYAAVALDEVAGPRLEALHWVYSGGAEGAATVLGTVAGSMITIAGVVFSLTLVALSLASSQLGPRLLQSFMRDVANQLVLGTFVATFLYCLLVLRTIRRDVGDVFVPHLSVTLGVILAVGSLAVLIYFIHHIALSIQADQVVARVYDELKHGIDRIFPGSIGEEATPDRARTGDADPAAPFRADEAQPIAATAEGYLQLVDADMLMTLATQAEVILRLDRRPGHYIVSGSPLAHAWPPDRVDDRLEAGVNRAFGLGNQRTPAQDVEFLVNQLVEVAVRALSPGVNDPFTAITCVDRLGSALRHLLQREPPSPLRHDESGALRVIASSITFPEMADAALNQIRRYARTSAAVTIRLLEVIAVIAPFAGREQDRDALRRHADMIARGAREALPEPEDRAVVDDRRRTVMEALQASSDRASPPPG